MVERLSFKCFIEACNELSALACESFGDAFFSDKALVSSTGEKEIKSLSFTKASLIGAGLFGIGGRGAILPKVSMIQV